MGSFSGTDANGDGYLSHLPFESIEELSSFSLVFSGNSIIGSFAWGLSELEAFSFDLDGDDILGNGIGSGPEMEGIGAAGGLFLLSVGGGFTFEDSNTTEVLDGWTWEILDASEEDVVVNQVPDTGSTSALFGFAALMVLAARRKFARAE
ncbi:VPDSG-CTERM sorting domain-containing protein [Pelagicoccus sp. SDUM812003]|uniref:VPDSG-CTERM sorting domain-containing protein n=1 Tax=Pelagicoccus sp. SDUM812003 TaxID=3041267 RepID=UPI00280C7C81|nr:VPDSG-CTERM sorting domain-containing protein [Pelagicoccus sp. SDUM812003]MDQ8204953.1 VPDSG-CTERM sorting domain-containing protein [Pelagicoccus sp. SDUM812003]